MKHSKHAATNGNSVANESGIEFRTLLHSEAILLLQKVRGSGKYSTYTGHVIDALQKLEDDNHTGFYVPEKLGADKVMEGKKLMTRLNFDLRKQGINHWVRFIQEDNMLVSEPHDWDK